MKNYHVVAFKKGFSDFHINDSLFSLVPKL